MTTVPIGPTLSASDLAASAEWWIEPTNLPAPFDGDVYLDLANGLTAALTPCTNAGKVREIRAALVKAIAATASASVFHGSDNDVFKLSLDLRVEIYLEIMRFRRAVLSDIKAGVVDA